jgi:hypothetical protein
LRAAQEQGYYKPHPDPSKEKFAIVIPPPNVTGTPDGRGAMARSAGGARRFGDRHPARFSNDFLSALRRLPRLTGWPCAQVRSTLAMR